jgi:preprotein translocase subunit SecG
MGLYYTISVLIFIVCVLLILIVLVQNSKGGGLTSTFSGSNQVMGVKRTTDFLEKSTWTLAIVLLVLTLSTIFVIPRGQTYTEQETSEIDFLRENPNAQPVNFQPVQQQETPEQPAAPEEQKPEGN